jgi:outer membrane protein assembly factor BamB
MLRIAPFGLALLFALASLLPAAPPEGNASSNWPRFRGPNGTGVSADKDIPTQWTEKNVLWKTPLPGIGHGSPIVWGDKLFIQSTSEDGSKRSLLCLSTTDGKVIWTQDVPGTKADEKSIHKKLNTLASSTPCTDGERVYVLFWDGKDVAMHAFDFAGKEVWKKDLGSFTSQHGVGASPIVHEGKVILNNDQDGKATLLALDAKKGDIVWKADRKPFRACYSTPFLLDKTDEGSELIVASTAGITGYNPQTGKENWNWTWTWTGMALRNVGSPIFSQGAVFALSGDGSGARTMVAVRPGGSGEVSKDSLLWKKDRDTPYVPCCVAQGDYVYGIHDKGTGLCIEAKTGKVMWSERVCGGVTASPVLINGNVYVIDESGEASVFPATPTFKAPLTSQVGEPEMASPAVAGGKLFIRGKNTLFCISKAK